MDTKKNKSDTDNLQLEKLILDTKINKYKLVNQVIVLTEKLKQQQEYKNLSYYDIFNIALKQIFKENEKES